MSKQKTDIVKLNEEEKKKLVAFFSDLPLDLMKSTAKAVSMMMRAVYGQEIEPTDIITKFTNVKNVLERSRFPTYPIVAEQVYMRLVAKYVPEAEIFEDWANLKAEALISYKGLSREEYVDVSKAASQVPGQQIYLDRTMKQQQTQPKKGFLSRLRGKPKEESEFVAQ